MSDPHALPDQPKTRRAEPLQPDRPSQGDGAKGGDQAGQPATAEKQKDQSKDALDNVRDGYR